MAVRDITEVQESLATNITTIDPSADVQKGPIRKTVVVPVAVEVQRNEADLDHLSQLVSLNFDAATSDDELAGMAGAFGIERDPGLPSTGFVTFFTATRPSVGVKFEVPVGTVVTTSDGQLAYAVTEAGAIDGDNADLFFNPATRRFEVTLPVEALAVGDDHDVPPTRVNTIQSQLESISGCTNGDAIEGGVSAETNAQLAARVRQQLLGGQRGLSGGVLAAARNASQKVKDAVAVYSTDISLFRRRTTRPGIDVYVIGEALKPATETFTALGSETSYVPTKQPVKAITLVTVNGTEATFTLERDSTRETGGSTIATDRIVFATPLTTGQVVTVEYTYNAILQDLQALYDSQEYLFGTKIVARTPFQVPIRVAINATALGSADPIRLAESLRSQVLSYVNPSAFTAVITPQVLRSRIFENVSGMSRLQISTFTRDDGIGSSFGVIALEKNELPFSDDTLVTISVKR